MSQSDSNVRKRKNEKPAYTCSENVEEYLTNSTLHGLRYVGNRKISYFERIFFGLSFIFVIVLSGYFISNIWNKWSATPIIIALNSRSTSIGDIPFPAVTICNYYLRHVRRHPDDEWDVDVDDFIDLPPTDWTPERGYRIEEGGQIYPRPGPGSGSHMGLTVVLNTNVDEYHCSTTNSQGFKVLLHSPTETPQLQNFGFSLTPGYESRVVITPKLSDASDKVRPIPQSQRKCVFANEANLSYFRTYSRKNCELECQSYLIEQACGCVLYFMPKMGNETPICNRDDFDCYRDMISAIELTQNETYSCNCLPGCFELSYSNEVSVAKLGTDQFYTKGNFAKLYGAKYSQRNVAIMHVYYEQNFFRSNSKQELIGFTEFLSSSGGLLGLFLGFSVISIIEIFYYLTFRPCFNRKKQLKIGEKLRFSRSRHRTQKIVQFEQNAPFKRRKLFGQGKHKDLELFKPKMVEPTNRYHYFE
ncbi:Pickpocket protein 28 [Pseudolycoriella hygida]|uniref:Pickpocket protein 28 n=1 Tax=Pseudolycoriella hygida TaxID=35572 RepID=A0A9Q0MPS8_9DIPT|nr:Pickpocket protein 28 [Pseudolycoriella hygida]